MAKPRRSQSRQIADSFLTPFIPSAKVAEFVRLVMALDLRRCHIKCEMKAPRIDPAVQELAVLSGLAALGCGLAAVQGDLLFVAIFGAASVVAIIEAIRRLRWDRRRRPPV